MVNTFFIEDYIHIYLLELFTDITYYVVECQLPITAVMIVKFKNKI